MELWQPYLRHRRRQGFNALQISILPILHDRSLGGGMVEPFAKTGDEVYDFSRRNERYFEKAEQMVAMAVEHGFVPVLGILWCCYAWNRGQPNPNRMTAEQVREFATFAAERFAPYDPVFFISGDTPQDDDEEIELYRVALAATKAACPDALCTMHIAGNRVIDERLMDGIDFYMYQSGHGGDRQTAARRLAQQFRALPPKPILNGEPCYEGHGRMGVDDRNKFTAFDVRRATWQSLLSGASMGITYGAQGIWSGHIHGMRLIHEKRKFEAYDWECAVQLPGAWDVGFAKWVFESFGLIGVQPVDGVRNAIVPADPEVVAAATPNLELIAAYAPYTTSLQFDVNLADFRVSCFNLEDRRVWTPAVRCGEPSIVEMPAFNHDMLTLAQRR